MHRTQISLKEEQYAFLAGEARRVGVSIAELLRRMVSARMQERAGADDPLEALMGIAEGDGTAVGREHDRSLYRSRQA